MSIYMKWKLLHFFSTVFVVVDDDDDRNDWQPIVIVFQVHLLFVMCVCVCDVFDVSPINKSLFLLLLLLLLNILPIVDYIRFNQRKKMLPQTIDLFWSNLFFLFCCVHWQTDFCQSVVVWPVFDHHHWASSSAQKKTKIFMKKKHILRFYYQRSVFFSILIGVFFSIKKNSIIIIIWRECCCFVISFFFYLNWIKLDKLTEQFFLCASFFSSFIVQLLTIQFSWFSITKYLFSLLLLLLLLFFQ